MGLPITSSVSNGYKEMRMNETQDQVQVNDTEQDSDVQNITVSVRSMDADVWHIAKIHCLQERITMAHYLKELLEADTKTNNP